MTDFLVSQLRAAAATRSDGDAHLMTVAADEMERQQQQINSQLRAMELLSEEILRKTEQILAAITRHLGPPPPSDRTEPPRG